MRMWEFWIWYALIKARMGHGQAVYVLITIDRCPLSPTHVCSSRLRGRLNEQRCMVYNVRWGLKHVPFPQPCLIMIY